MTKNKENITITPAKIRQLVEQVLKEVTVGPKKPPAEPGALGSRRAGPFGKSAVFRPRGEIRAAETPPGRKKLVGGVLALGGDHGGFGLKESLKAYLAQELDLNVRDMGTHSRESVDYPDFALAVARAVASGECEKGIVIDTMGIGSSIAANKVRGIRAALCHDVTTARNSRAHNDANVLALGSKVVNPGHARRIVREWLATPFEGGRHGKRVQKIVDAEGA